MKRSLYFGIILASLFFVTIVGCEYEDTTRITELESQLNSVKSELISLEQELGHTQQSRDDAKAALSACEANELGALKVVNDATNNIFSLYVSPQADEEWGPDLLDESGVILGSGYHHVRYFPLKPGAYDILAEFDWGNDVESVKTILPGQVTTQRYINE